MFIVIYKNPYDKDYEDFFISNSKDEVKDILANFKYPLDYRVFDATERYDFKEEKYDVSHKTVF